jgi:subtilase family serine protease
MRLMQWCNESVRLMSVCGFILTAVCFTPTTSAETKSMITATAASTRLVKIPGAVHPLVKTSIATGSLASNKMLDLHIALNRPEESNKALDQLIQAQVNPSSSQYHHWLTPAQIGAQYGANNSDIQQISNWLKANHLTVTSVNPSHNMINVRGSVQNIQSAFQTPLKTFKINGKTRYANVVEPSIPAAFTNAISSVVGLHNIPFKSTVQTRHVNPAFTDQGNFFQTVADLVTQYNIAPLYQKSITGSGVSVAIIGQGLVDPDYVKTFWQQIGVTPTNPIQLLSPPGFNADNAAAGDAVEAYLDVEMVSSIAYVSKVMTVTGNILEDALVYAVEQNLAGIMSISYGSPENNEASESAFLRSILQQAAAQGITVMISTGDSGSTIADVDQAPAYQDLQVSGLATTPYAVAVGGTQLDPRVPLPLNSATSPTQSNLSRYTGEVVWNRSCAAYPMYTVPAGDTDVLSYCNDPHVQDGRKLPIGGSGGISSCAYQYISDSGLYLCQAGIPVPSWQSGVVGIKQWPGRAIPDISMVGAGVVICDDPTTPCQIVQGGVNASYSQVDGTSISAPVFASVMALVAQTQITATNPQGRMGLINPLLYQLAANQYGSSAANAKPLLAGCDASHADRINKDCVFYDITTGNNSVPCSVRDWTQLGANPTATCASRAGFSIGVVTAADGTLAYTATPGYDLATGLGSVNVTNFVAAINAVGSVKNLIATPSGSSVTLSWDNDPSATSYNIYQGVSTGNEAATPVMTKVAGNSVQITGLTSGQAYFFKVAALTKFGLSAMSNEVSFIAPPDAPTGLTSSTSGTSVTLNWNTSPSATSYSVYQGTSAGAESLTPVASGLTTTSYTVAAAAPGSTLYFVVAAFNAGGSSPNSVEQVQPVAPGAPSGLTALAGNGSVQLNWTAGAGATVYNVYMGNAAGKESATPYLKAFGGTSVVITNLDNFSNYFFVVKSVNASVESPASTEVSATPTAPKTGGGGGDIGLYGLGLLIALGLIQQRRHQRTVVALRP